MVRRILRTGDDHVEVTRVVVVRRRADARVRLLQQPLRLLLDSGHLEAGAD
eukprot:CAMPEP_0180249916 /NCGR_PEP_ID=MMETSP0987-20121128/37582_1 /TAXON_ID=697907 /ORGANISM="non described non described, Strain CCMP2293" /LENGTH=50 /DNA_ID=CAMNT_0022218269 /DNA_START=630 /DNA_END=779 /DNA_ORIENTATION=-